VGLNLEQSAAASHVHEASIKVSTVCLEGRYGAIHAASFQLVTTHGYTFTAVTRVQIPSGTPTIQSTYAKTQF